MTGLPGGGGAQKPVHQNEVWSDACLQAVHLMSVHLNPMRFNWGSLESVQHPTP